MTRIKFQCLHCKSQLISENDKIICADCNSSWPIVNNIPHFIESAPYWGEVSHENMVEINRQMKTKYWRTIFEHSKIPEVRTAYGMISSLRKSFWHLLLDIDKNSIILDVGAGSGVLSEALSYDYRHIVAVEPVVERIDFMQMRFQQEQRDNITIVRANILDLPFPESSFHLAVMSGVLEWVPLSEQNSGRNHKQTD